MSSAVASAASDAVFRFERKVGLCVTALRQDQVIDIGEALASRELRAIVDQGDSVADFARTSRQRKGDVTAAENHESAGRALHIEKDLHFAATSHPGGVFSDRQEAIASKRGLSTAYRSLGILNDQSLKGSTT